MADCAEELCERWRLLAGSAPIRLDDEFAQFTMRILESCLFPAGLGETAQYPAAQCAYLARAGKPGIQDFLPYRDRLPRLAAILEARSIAAMRGAARHAIDRWRRTRPASSFAILDGMHAASDSGSGLSQTEIEDNVRTLISAGFETSANALCWAMFLLSQDEEWRSRVESEADRELADGKFRTGIVDRLVAARAVVEETLRLYPTVPVTVRQANNADEIEGIGIGAGDIVVVSPWLVHRHRLHWSDGDLFDPSRFLPGTRERIARYSFIPFGAGTRVCIGQGFAVQEMTIAVATICRRFRLDPSPGFRIWPLHRVTLQPSGRLSMNLSLRPS